MRSAPTSPAGSYRMGMPVFTPGSTTSGSCPRYSRDNATRPGVSGGTTLARATPPMSAGATPEPRKRLRTRMPYSSVVCSRRVVSRQCAFSASPSWTPSTVLVLPTSMVRSRGMVSGSGCGRPHFADLAGVHEDSGAIAEDQDERARLVHVDRPAVQDLVPRSGLHLTAPPRNGAGAPGGDQDRKSVV